MKDRIKIDSAILSLAIIMTGVLYKFPHLYSSNRFLDNVWDFIGLMIVLKGIFIRMLARGHKKVHSKEGSILVITGIYTLSRNPMYLGSFLMGAGFVFIVWPWWTLPLFAALFYLRFHRQVILEEEHLQKLFKEDYITYSQKVSRVFPTFTQIKAMKVKQIVNLKEVFSTQEKWGLIGWPILAVFLETLQEKIVFGYTNFELTVSIFLEAMIAYVILEFIKYQLWN